MGDGGNAKIGEQHFLVLPDQHILRLDITMDKLLFVRILQGVSYICLTAETITGRGTRLPFGYRWRKVPSAA